LTKQKYYKFLAENLASYHTSTFHYPSPTFDGKKWIPTPWIEEKNCDDNKEACGRGLHLMKVLKPRYHPYKGNCYEAEGEDLLGEDDDKARFRRIRLLRPVPKEEIFQPKANLWNANLSDADLRNANLSDANLWNADLRNANLRNANLSDANLWNADLRNANLRNANLRNADLRNADLTTCKNLDAVRNPEKAYWNKFTKVTDDFKKLLSKDRFSE